MSFDNINAVIPKLMKKYNLVVPIEAAQLVEVAKKVIFELYGENIMQFLEVRYVKNDILFINVKNSIAAQEIQMNKLNIINKINATNNTVEKLKDIRFRCF